VGQRCLEKRHGIQESDRVETAGEGQSLSCKTLAKTQGNLEKLRKHRKGNHFLTDRHSNMFTIELICAVQSYILRVYFVYKNVCEMQGIL
jgi:hypothetical protein